MLRDMQLKMRVSKAEKELYSKEAKKRGFTISDFVRYCIQGQINLTSEEGDRK